VRKILTLMAFLIGITGTAFGSDDLKSVSTALSKGELKVSVQESPSTQGAGNVVAFTHGTSVTVVSPDCSYSSTDKAIYCSGQKVATVQGTYYYLDDHSRYFYRLVPVNSDYVELSHYDRDGESVLMRK